MVAVPSPQELTKNPKDFFVKKNPFREGEKIFMGFGGFGFYDYNLVYKESDFLPIRQLFLQLRQNLRHNDDEMMKPMLSAGLTEAEARDVASAWEALISFNGGELTHGQDKANERVATYKQADERNTGVPLRVFQNSKLMECGKITAVLHDIFTHFSQYQPFRISGVTENPEGSLEGHNFMILRSRRDSGRNLLVDMSNHSVQPGPHGNATRTPFVEVLSDDQLKTLQAGQDIQSAFLGQQHMYRIGTAHTSPGAWNVGDF